MIKFVDCDAIMLKDYSELCKGDKVNVFAEYENMFGYKMLKTGWDTFRVVDGKTKRFWDIPSDVIKKI